jgi:uncharacterized damage-inducible protein DinB
MSEKILRNFLDETISTFRSYKKLAENAMEQISDEEFFQTIDGESNSIAVIAKHVGGNLRSRWTDFLTTDGEKPNRNRDAEFAEENDSRENILQIWEIGWNAVISSFESLSIADLDKIITIRGEEFTVVRAINRSITHTAYHVGQIVFLAKHLRSEKWKTLSIPKNKSAQFNKYLSGKEDKGNYLETGREFAEKEQ